MIWKPKNNNKLINKPPKVTNPVVEKPTYPIPKCTVFLDKDTTDRLISSFNKHSIL